MEGESSQRSLSSNSIAALGWISGLDGHQTDQRDDLKESIRFGVCTLPGQLNFSCGAIKFEVEFEDVDAGLAEETELAIKGMLRYEMADSILSEVTLAGYAGNLKLRASRRDVGVQTGSGSGAHLLKFTHDSVRLQ